LLLLRGGYACIKLPAWDVDPIFAGWFTVNDTIRLAELLGSLSFAGDLGRGQPVGHVLRTTRIAMALAERLPAASGQVDDVYYTSLLVHAGCTAGSSDFAAFLASDELSAQKDFCLCDPANMGQLFGWLNRNVAKGKPLPARTLRMLQLISRGEGAFQDIDQGCSEVGSRIATRLGMSEATQLSLYHICETWNGKGPHKLKQEDVPLPGRIVNVAMILEVFFTERGVAAAKEAATARRGKSFDPDVAGAAIALCEDDAFWAAMREQEPWASVLDLEPKPVRHVDEATLDDFAFALADIVDLKLTATASHSRRVAELAEQVATRLSVDPSDIALTRRAALAHDVGMVAVPTFLMEQSPRWSESDYERYRLHPYFTERILSRSEVLRPIGAVAGAHHEALDGSGFHRNLTGPQLSLPARIVAATCAFLEAEEAAPEASTEAVLSDLGKRGTLDGDCLRALSGAIGVRLTQRASTQRPSGLTEREMEVLRLVATGLNLKEAAGRLVISDHTARHHLESIYSKAGVSSRAGLTLYAVENGLLA
jgi:HD-GYP domain-containing protein (c-di-GMP phosphodiesterase class II)/DNA-binding CsgD family transcriptional regulator